MNQLPQGHLFAYATGVLTALQAHPEIYLRIVQALGSEEEAQKFGINLLTIGHTFYKED